jgi:hypothetical protein
MAQRSTAIECGAVAFPAKAEGSRRFAAIVEGSRLRVAPQSVHLAILLDAVPYVARPPIITVGAVGRIAVVFFNAGAIDTPAATQAAPPAA